MSSSYCRARSRLRKQSIARPPAWVNRAVSTAPQSTSHTPRRVMASGPGRNHGMPANAEADALEANDAAAEGATEGSSGGMVFALDEGGVERPTRAGTFSTVT